MYWPSNAIHQRLIPNYGTLTSIIAQTTPLVPALADNDVDVAFSLPALIEPIPGTTSVPTPTLDLDNENAGGTGKVGDRQGGIPHVTPQ